MTVRLLAAYGIYPANAIVTLDAGTETGLIAAKLASANLTGGVAYTAPSAPNQFSRAQVVKDGAGNVLGLADANGNLISSGSVAATVTGTGIVGEKLTATLPTGVTGTLQFFKALKVSPFTKSPIAGAIANAVNSLQYTVQQADGPYNLGCDSSNTVSASNVIGGVAGPDTVYSTATDNFVWDGNSLVFGVGTTTPATDSITAQLAADPLLNGCPVANTGVSGQNIAGMRARIAAQINPKYVAGKDNRLLVWELTNDMLNGTGNLPATSIANLMMYISEVRTANPGWIVIVLTTLPRYDLIGATSNDAQTGPLTIAQANARLNTANALLQSQYLAMGASAVIDVRADGTFAYVDGATSPLNPALWSDGTHLTKAGYTSELAGQVIPFLRTFVPVADTTTPTLLSATVHGSTAVLTFSESLRNTAPTLSSLSLVLGGGAAINPTSAVVAGNTIALGFATSATVGQSATVSYVPGASPLRDLTGNNAVAFSAVATTNTTAATGTGRLINTRLLVEAGAPGSYAYTGSGAAFSTTLLTDGAGVLDAAFQPGVDGFFSLISTVTPVQNTGPQVIVGVGAAVAVGTYNAIDYTTIGGNFGTYAMFLKGVGGSGDASISAAANDSIRISRIGTTLVFAISKNAGATWTNLKTYVGVNPGVLYVQVRMAYASNITTLTTSGLA
nr:GDSL-type esterase/lipase family protein [uncultured Duganella sp.]